MKNGAKLKDGATARRARRVTAPSQPRYDQGLRFDTPGLRYAVVDPVPPVNDGAKVKLALESRSDVEMLAFADNHITEMTGNPNFPTPMPSAAAFQAVTDDFRAAYAAHEAAAVALADTGRALEAARAVLAQNFNVRGSYVQAASNGNAQVIVSSGLEVRNPRTPVGQLSWPQNFRVELNGARGLMLLQWQAVSKAEGYLVRYREQGTDNWVQPARCSKPKLELTDMPVGKTFIFQAAALGGAGGQSLWSPEVSRAAA